MTRSLKGKCLSAIGAVVTTFTTVTSAFELTIPSAYQNYQERAKVQEDLQPLTHQFAGERIDYYSGSITFNITDVKVPGNDTLPVMVSRTLRPVSTPSGSGSANLRNSSPFGDWAFNIPKVQARVADDSQMVCGLNVPDTVYDDTLEKYLIPWNTYFDGISFTDVSGNKETIYKVKPKSKPDFVPSSANYYTKSKWIFECNGDYFIAKSPQGHKYTFDKRNIQSAPTTQFSVPLPGTNEKEPAYAFTNYVSYLVSKIEDKHGNSVTYSYTKKGEKQVLNYIHASDGRRIDFTHYPTTSEYYVYTQKIKTVTTNGKTWAYTYDGDRLQKVELPDNNYWEYTGELRFNLPKNVDAPSLPNFGKGPHHFTVKHPYNGKAEYTFDLGWLHRLGYRYAAWTYCVYWDGLIVPEAKRCSTVTDTSCYSDTCLSRMPTVAITRKRVNTLNEEYVWDFEIENFDEKYPDHYKPDVFPSFPEPDPAKATQRVTVTGPNTVEERVFNRWLGPQEGNLLHETVYSRASVPLKKTQYTYISEPHRYEDVKCPLSGSINSESGSKIAESDSKNFESGLGTDINCHLLVENKNPKTTSITLYDDETGEASSTYLTDIELYNTYGAVERQKQQYGTDVRYTLNNYTHDLNNWQLNLPTTLYIGSTVENAILYKETTYNENFQPYKYKLFGDLISTSTYYADGTLDKIDYAGSNRYEKFEQYMRGIPQKITYPCAKKNGCDTANESTQNTLIAKFEVNSDGTLKSATDFKGHKISYTYNSVGWLTGINYSDTKWHDASISYTVVNAINDDVANSGVKVGQLKSTYTKGAFKKHTYYDGMLRRVLTITEDSNNPSFKQYQKFTYNAENQNKFTSFVGGSLPLTSGTINSYDALGRLKTVSRNTDSSTTAYSYKSDNSIRVTDPNGNTVTTKYLAYGQPIYDKPTYIDAQDSSDTTLTYNIFEQAKSIKQGTITESRFYDAKQRLCKTTRPETGKMIFGYNSQRQVAWLSTSFDETVKDGCEPDTAPATRQINTYNNLGMLSQESYSDDTPSKQYSYDALGNLAGLKHGKASWEYRYNTLNLLEHENLSVDGKTFASKRSYNALGHLSSITYPSNRKIDYAPDAFGYPSKAGPYARDIEYYPDGAIKKFTYGNGIVRQVSLDDSQRTEKIHDTLGKKDINHFEYSYDSNDNTNSIKDYVNLANEVKGFKYDRSNRLLSASGPWGKGSFTYDGLGNIETMNINNQALDYEYNASNQLFRVKNGNDTIYSFIYDTKGNVTNNGKHEFTYNYAQQMETAGQNNYTYDGHNRRVKKQTSTGNSYYFYSQSGTILHRLSADNVSTDSVYLNNMLIVEVDKL